MNIHEHQAKALLKTYGLPVADGVAIFTASEAEAAAADEEEDRTLGVQDTPQAISVAWAPRQTRTEPVEPPVTTTSR